MSKLNKSLFSSANDEWETPQDFFDMYDEIFHFDMDVCANETNRKCEKYFDKEMDGLQQEWKGTCWMNPPYGRQIGKWIKKAYESSLNGATVVCLLPSRTDTKWFHDYCLKGEIFFIKGRLKFVNAKSSAPFPSMVVIFRGNKEDSNEKGCHLH